MVLLLREENEMKAEARADVDRRRLDEEATREEGYHAEKKETEERRSQDNLEREERARRQRRCSSSYTGIGDFARYLDKVSLDRHLGRRGRLCEPPPRPRRTRTPTSKL
ncbi:hypothetical protein L914_14938 [Phytophthora nicotianae]|uniref:Uncharacterized protein n=1 Tax=Phytophthora nicotianae TaxID=4792 RepID=W2MTP2_PHYNI|nr:hypothetical protein L914_14938 [Phytophthora nicotianae]